MSLKQIWTDRRAVRPHLKQWNFQSGTSTVEWTTSSLQELINELRKRQGDANDVEVKAVRQSEACNPRLRGPAILGLDRLQSSS